MKERGDRLCAERKYCLRERIARLFGCRASRAASLSMIKNENTEDPVREKPTTGHELNSRDQDHGPADLGKAELWAGRLLSEYWDGKFPVDPNSIAVKMGNNASTSRKRFTIAHELGHCVEKLIDSEPPNQKIPGYFGFSDESMVSDEKILAGRRPTDSGAPDQSPRELFADYFACCLLIPENEVQRFVGLGVNIDDVATHFGVSAATMRNRLNDLGIDL